MFLAYTCFDYKIIERILFGVWVYYKISYDLGKYLLCKGKCHKSNLQELR